MGTLSGPTGRDAVARAMEVFPLLGTGTTAETVRLSFDRDRAPLPDGGGISLRWRDGRTNPALLHRDDGADLARSGIEDSMGPSLERGGNGALFSAER